MADDPTAGAPTRAAAAHPPSPAPARVTLDNCADEPIHVPGSIQPHGALLALEGECVVAWSANLPRLLGRELQPGQPWTTLGLPDAVAQALAHLIDETADQDGAAAATPVSLSGDPNDQHDLIVHRHLGRTLIEFEHRSQSDDQVAGFALLAHRAMERLKKAPDLDSLLQRLAREVRALTGFDRVMTYRFRHDHSGDVVGEDCADGLPPYLGMRYPASDIPAQARRLYTLNTLRLIADIGYTPVPLLGAPDAPALDLTHAVLRSVSPIHVEYLQNMGVGASMSVSIVVQDRLWGLVACHHMGPRQVPYSVRMACDVLAQIVASAVQTLQARDEASWQATAARLDSELARELDQADDPVAALIGLAPALLACFEAEAVVVAQRQRVRSLGPLPEGLAEALIEALRSEQPEHDASIWSADAASDWPQPVRERLQGWVGGLALLPDRYSGVRLLLLRREQVATIRWGGPPDDKRVVVGPLGPRLTPRGSFAEWRETVRGRSLPWTELQRQAARDTLHTLQRSLLMRQAETEMARQKLLAMLGHDLRDPLQAIRMVAGQLKHDDTSPRLASRLESSSRRMQRLIAQVLDFSRAEAGLRLAVSLAPVTLAVVVDDLVEESRIGHPEVLLHWSADATARAARVLGDADRLAQLVGNLLSNARHHGEQGQPVHLELVVDGGWLRLTVRNAGRPIEPDIAANLFEAWRRGGPPSPRNRDGLGLGLHIAGRIAQEHGARLSHRHQAPWVVFECALPVWTPAGT